MCLKESREKINKSNVVSFSYPNFLKKMIFCFFSIIQLKPFQFGLFFSKEMKLYIENCANNYDYLFFHTIRSSQYLPNNFHNRIIMEMGDLYSDNYFQTFKNLNFLNPLKYIYYLEGLLVKRIEIKIFDEYDRITLFQK